MVNTLKIFEFGENVTDILNLFLLAILVKIAVRINELY